MGQSGKEDFLGGAALTREAVAKMGGSTIMGRLEEGRELAFLDEVEFLWRSPCRSGG